MKDKVKSAGYLSMVMLPAKKNAFLTDDNMYTITIPRRGDYKGIDPDFFDTKDGGFDILNDNGVIFLPAIVKVLFATKQYPALEDNQIFVPLLLKFKDVEIEITGQVIEMEKELISNKE